MLNERPTNFRETICPVDNHPCEGQGTMEQCDSCTGKPITIAEATALRKRVRMDWTKIKEQRDSDGNLTPLALACDALENYGCDCGTDEPGTCLACLCKAALEDLSAQLAEL